VEGAKELTVTMADKGEFKAQVVGRDPKTDIAIIKIDAGENLPAANIGDSDQIKVGDWVLAIGNPFGLSHTVTSGIVSAKGRVIGAGPYDDFIQTDASINPGNSGGPLFNMKGEVIGINTAIIPEGQGIGFAIPVNTAKSLIPQLEANGEVTRGYLGVNIQSIDPDLAKAMKLEQSKGALVAEVVPGGPADKAGIKTGDVIVSFDGKSVHDSHDLPAMVAAAAIGRQVPITLVRNGKEIKIDTVVAKLESSGTKVAESRLPAQGKWGLQLQDLNPEIARQLGLDDDHGVVVAGVQPGSPAYRASIQPGDVIMEVNRQRVKSASDLKEKIAKANDSDALLLLVKDAHGSRYVVLKG
jgi:serine protease Do